MKESIAILIVIFLLGCSCTREELPPTTTENGILIEKPYIWWNKEEEHDASVEAYRFSYNSSFIAESHQKGKSFLSLIDSKAGKLHWKWNDYYNETDRGFLDYYSFNDYLIFQEGPRSYCLNLVSGTTQWKKIWPTSLYVSVGGYKETCFLIQDYADAGATHPGILLVNLPDGSLFEKIIPHFENFTNRNVSGEFGRIIDVNAVEKNGKVYFLISYCESINSSRCLPLISLYNYSDKNWVYQYKRITSLEQNALSFVDIQNDKIYHDGGLHVFCNDLWTGDSIWTQKFKGNFLFGSCLVDNGTIYCASEGDGYYALDAETGAIKWKGDRAPGTSSRMVILNGVLYYINGADGRLWALDAATGKTLWKLKSPDNNFGFKREINVMKGDAQRKGYVMTSTWHGACAYEAER